MTVDRKAPRNPSHVLLGDSLIKLVRPKKNPVEGVKKRDEGGREMSEGSLTEEVGHDVIAYHHGDGKEEPEKRFKYILHDEVSLRAQHEHGKVCPGKLDGMGKRRGEKYS